VNVGDPRYDHVFSIDDLPPHYLQEIQNFFRTYKTLQHKVTEVGEFFGVDRAVAILDESFSRYVESLRP
ncbi:MAG: inorganic diphosphatase, partial [Akkermansia sp.]|nr:inorganic diphosphatase [Akkermansia sp.]